MRKIAAILFALVSASAFADSDSEHLEHLKMMMHAMSQHGAPCGDLTAFRADRNTAKSVMRFNNRIASPIDALKIVSPRGLRRHHMGMSSIV